MSWSEAEIKKLNLIAGVLSVLILLVVVFMRKIHFETAIDFRFLPAFHSSVNAICGLVLIIAYVQIRKKNIEAHKKLMSLAMALSAVFLISYVLYHTTTPEQKFCKEGFIRLIYFSFLISHVVLAAVSFPAILFTYIRGLTRQHPAHERLAKWIFPVWLYICISGPVCYMLLRPCMV